MILSARLLQGLRRSRFAVGGEAGMAGIGERRSRAKGAGMEFADLRGYMPGDDLRHLDPHVHARLGTYVVRQYEVQRQLPVTIVVDATGSMAFGTPSKFAFAQTLAAALVYVALAGGDNVQVVMVRGGRADWSPRRSGTRAARTLFDWLAAGTCEGNGLAAALRRLAGSLPQRGLVFLLSDWWLDNPAEILPLVSGDRELVAVQVLAPEEAEPAGQAGATLLVDAETGAEVELMLDGAALEAYGSKLASWQEQLRQLFVSRGGRFLPVRSDAQVERLVLREWRRIGLIA